MSLDADTTHPDNSGVSGEGLQRTFNGGNHGSC
jgi:hypothetical protein